MLKKKEKVQKVKLKEISRLNYCAIKALE